MKRKLLAAFIILLSSGYGFNVAAQSFSEDTREITAFVGGADIFHIPVGYIFNSFIYPTTFEAGAEGEFAVHKYIGVGFVAELGGRGALGGPIGYYYTTFYPEFNMAIGAIGNFHFYQLIADKTGSNMLADKIDVYAGLNLGTGFAIHPATLNDGLPATATDVLFFIGPQVGIHYFFTPKIAINGDFGWGKTWARVGVTFKLR